MKPSIPTRSILFLLLFLLASCQTPGNQLVATATNQPPKIETPTIVPTSSIPALTPTPTPTKIERKAGEIAYAHVEAISEGIGARVAGTEEEVKTANYIVSEFERLGYSPQLQPFRVTVKGNIINSANVIAVKEGASPLEIIVGAHYDSVKVGKGADDNATGVAVILEVAERIKDMKTPYTIRFILFGAEEVGLQGSKYYVGSMTMDDIQKTIGMTNLDSVTAGDLAYVYGDEGERGVIRDWLLGFAQDHGLTLQTQLGENAKYPLGTTGDWSDHAPFKKAGIPYTYFEATNWALGDKDGYTQVSTEYGQAGEIWHTDFDTLEYINTTFPGRMQERLNLFVTLLEAALTEFELPK